MENSFLNERAEDIGLLETEIGRMMDLSNKIVEQKRTFLISTTSVSTSIIAGLLIFMTATHDYDWRFIFGAILFVASIIFTHVYLSALFALESRKLDHELDLRKGTLNKYKEAMRQTITDPNIYSQILASIPHERNKLKYTYKLLEFFSKERFFILSNTLFIFAFLWLFFSFLCRIVRLS